MTEDAQRKVIDDLACIVPEDGYLVLGVKEQLAGSIAARLRAGGRPPRPLPPQPRLRGRRGLSQRPAGGGGGGAISISTLMHRSASGVAG